MDKNKLTYFITGGGGYLGTVLVPILLNSGHYVKVLDRFFWGKELVSPYQNNNLELIEADSRTYPASHLTGVDVVIDLAALSNDPIGELNTERTLEINHKARVRTATLSKEAGVKKYILASSCSVYGFRDELLTEQSSLAPVTTYAKASMLAEQGILELADENFCVTALRQGTLYGISPRMRFDLVLNTMVHSIFKNNLISVQGGQQWRPILHVEDSARAFILISELDQTLALEMVNKQVFNVGSNEQNFQMQTLAKLIVDAIKPDAKIITQDVQTDFRSYQVSFDRINQQLGYTTKITPQLAAQDIYRALQNNLITDSINTKTIDWYKHLLDTNPKALDPLT